MFVSIVGRRKRQKSGRHILWLQYKRILCNRFVFIPMRLDVLYQQIHLEFRFVHQTISFCVSFKICSWYHGFIALETIEHDHKAIALVNKFSCMVMVLVTTNYNFCIKSIKAKQSTSFQHYSTLTLLNCLYSDNGAQNMTTSEHSPIARLKIQLFRSFRCNSTSPK